ncbi:hypothetical protein ACO0SA_004289 [Hanseniaspora valbyensis]
MKSLNKIVNKIITRSNSSISVQTKKFPCKIKDHSLVHYHIKNEYADYTKISELQLSKLNEFLLWYRKNPLLKLNELKKTNINEYNRIMSLKPKPTIISMQFNPVYTAGKKFMKTVSNPQKLSEPYRNFIPPSKTMLDPKIDINLKHQSTVIAPTFELINRGGKITFHGPGQLVMYFIFDLKDFLNLDIKKYISLLESTLKDVTKTKGLECVNYNDEVGIFIKNENEEKTKKLASIGINLQKLVTSHGISMNLNNNLSYLNTFEMCGLGNLKQTSIFNETGEISNVENVAKDVVKRINSQLGTLKIDYKKIDQNELLNL